MEEKDNTEETVTISRDDYERYLRYSRFIQNWHPTLKRCPVCGELNPIGYCCMECGYKFDDYRRYKLYGEE